jgi:hypothetical protein
MNQRLSGIPVRVLLGSGTLANPACDICDQHGKGNPVAANDLRHAVFQKGFNPFVIGLNQTYETRGMSAEVAYGNFKTLVAQDQSDWNVCATCSMAMKPYLPEHMSPTGQRVSAFMVELTGV